MTASTDRGTGTSNETYNLVSLLYHALEGAATYEKYVQDAEQAGDQELAQFFREVHQNTHQVAEKAKQLLGKRMS